MKKILLILISAVLITAQINPALAYHAGQPKAVMGGVSSNGRLQVNGTQLCNENGTPVILRGMSSHGMQWYPHFASNNAIKNTADHGANVFRIAMYTGEGGYLTNKNIKHTVIDTIDTVLALDLYVIIDCHILSDSNLNGQLPAAKEFFHEISARYKDNPALIYEICNEPNGGSTWKNDIYPYASEVIPVIRSNSPNAIIICGTSTWCQDIDLVAAQPLPYHNVMYALHFYAGTHNQNLRDKVERALDAGTPVFVSEWGTSQANGSSGTYLEEAQTWLDYLAARNISWVNWSLCDKNESSAALVPGTPPDRTWTADDFSESGQFVFSHFPLHQ